MPIEARRRHLDGLLSQEPGSNLGLYFNRYVEKIDVQGDRGDNQSAFLETLCRQLDKGALTLYRAALEHWQELAEADADTEVFVMETASPLLCGMGNKNALEIGATFMHPYGMPYLPGSSIKGVASSYAEGSGGDSWRKTNAGQYDGGEASVTLFGGIQRNRSFAAAVDVLDAWWIPRDTQSPFMLDILTPHQKSYYAGKGFPDGTDSPVPVTFLVLKPGQKFLFSVRGQEPLRRLAKTIIRQAFEAGGAGGKTRSGYGRFTYEESAKDKAERILAVRGPDELKRLVTVKDLDDAAIARTCAKVLENMPYSAGLDTYFRKVLPVRWLRARLEATPPTTYKAANDLRKDAKLKSENLDRSQEDVQAIFNQCVRHLPREDIKEWIADIAYTWDDLLAGKKLDDILEIIEENRCWPDRALLPDALRRLPQLSPEEKETVVGLL